MTAYAVRTETASQESPRVFRSRHHPGTRNWPLVYGRALVPALVGFQLPVMIVGLVAVLEQLQVWPWLFYLFGAALVLAVGWTHLRLRMRISEIRVYETAIVVATIYDAFRGTGRTAHERVFDVRESRDGLSVAAGQRLYELEARDWPDWPGLVAALREARSNQHAQPY